MEFGSIERELYIEAAPDVVFAVVSDPVHVSRWWPDEASYPVHPGAAGELVFTHEGAKVPVAIEVVDAQPPRLFSFRWTQPEGEQARAENSFLVTFTLEASGRGTLLRLVETGFEERGWDAAAVEAAYLDHGEGWDYHLGRLAPYVATLVRTGVAR